VESLGQQNGRIRPRIDDNRVANFAQDFGITRAAEGEEPLHDFADLRAAATDRRLVVRLLQSPPQDVLVHERQELLQVARFKRGTQFIAMHAPIIGPRGGSRPYISPGPAPAAALKRPSVLNGIVRQRGRLILIGLGRYEKLRQAARAAEDKG